MSMNPDNHPARVEIILKPGEKVSICRCWRSTKFPFCDGAHRAYCEQSSENVGPAIVKVEAQDKED